MKEMEIKGREIKWKRLRLKKEIKIKWKRD